MKNNKLVIIFCLFAFLEGCSEVIKSGANIESLEKITNLGLKTQSQLSDQNYRLKQLKANTPKK